MAEITSHIHHAPPAAPATVDPAWKRWSTAWTKQITVLTGRTDLTVTVAPGAGRGAPACYLPSLAAVEVDADLIGDPTITDPRRPGHKKAVPGPYGALVHESAHAVHSRWHTPPHIPPVVAFAAAMLEESRAEHHHRRRRPRDRQWLRHCVKLIVAADDAPTDSPWNAAYAAGLLLARVDARILTPADVRPLRRAVTGVLGAKTLKRLRRIWRQAHTVADDDAEAMVDLGRQWCHALGIDPDTTPNPPDPNDGTGTTVGSAIGAVIGGLDAPPQPPPPPPADPEPDMDDYLETPASWTLRPPTPAERQAAVRLGALLARARSREPVTTLEGAATPPGRLRTRQAMAAAAQRAAGATPTALPWQRTVRRPAPDPDLAVAVLVDVSGSMGDFAAPLSSAAWILAHAAHRAQATTATIAIGGQVTIVVPPGRRPPHVRDMRADAPTERFDDAVAAADRLLHLTSPGTARLAVVVSDGLFYGNGIDAAQHTIDRLITTGCAVLWLTPAGQDVHVYTGPTTVPVNTPTDCITLIGRAAADALAKR